MKALMIALIAASLCACVSQKTTAGHPPEDKAQVDGFPAEWLKEPEKHGLPTGSDGTADKKGEPRQ